jgi:hypothetical protein
MFVNIIDVYKNLQIVSNKDVRQKNPWHSFQEQVYWHLRFGRLEKKRLAPIFFRKKTERQFCFGSKSRRPGVDVMITILVIFANFFKNQCFDNFFHKLAIFWAKNAIFFAKFFGENI